jgi:pimeloyl-ACP methyl ester carboxylesterase
MSEAFGKELIHNAAFTLVGAAIGGWIAFKFSARRKSHEKRMVYREVIDDALELLAREKPIDFDLIRSETRKIRDHIGTVKRWLFFDPAVGRLSHTENCYYRDFDVTDLAKAVNAYNAGREKLKDLLELLRWCAKWRISG